MFQSLAENVVIAIVGAVFILAVVIVFGYCISHREELRNNRIISFAQLAIIIVFIIVFVYFLINDIIPFIDFIIFVSLLLLYLLCFDWSRLTSKDDIEKEE